MNRYDFWRFFGPLPKPPEAAYVRDPDRALSALIAEYRAHPADRRTLENMVSFAFIFCRLDSLSDVMSHDDWGVQPSGPLFRAWLRYYRALAENPDSPDWASLDKAEADLEVARGCDESYFDAQASLVRIICLKEGLQAAIRLLKMLEFSAWTRHRQAGLPAVAGVRLFLADFPGVSQSEKRRHLRHARRMLIGSLSAIPRSGNSDEREELTLILAEVETRLGRRKAALHRLVRLSGEGSLEAQCFLLGHDAEEQSSGPSSVLLESLAEYRKQRPSDPRSFLYEGDLMMPKDPDTARMAWRSALVMDNRYVQAWLRLGDLYKEIWNRGEEAHRDTYLEAASDSYLKAVGLDPLNPGCRLRLGIVEREAGRPARALVTLQGAMALVSDDSDIRRWLALSWTDMAYSDDLSSHARSASAGRAREEWERLFETTGRNIFDVLGLLRSRVLESAEDTDSAVEYRNQIDTLLTELIAGSTEDMSEDLLELTEDFLQQGLSEQASRLLDRLEGFIPHHPGYLTSRAVLESDENPEAAVSLFLHAAEAREPCESDYVECLLGAADALRRTDRIVEAKGVLLKGLNICPADRNMVRALADLHISEGDFNGALQVYENAVSAGSGNTGLLDDGVWLSRDIGFPSFGEKWLKGELSGSPENSYLWNQLGVHYMEIGWDESSGSPEMEMLQKALEAYRRAVDIEPENTVFLGNLGDALRQAGKWIEADEVLGRALKNNDTSDEGVFALNSMARLLDERSYASEGTDAAADDWADCGNFYQKAAVQGKGNIDFIRDYAWWLYRERRLEEAIEQYRRGMVIDPGDEALHYGESMCWRELGDIKQALSAMGRALALKPSDMHITAEMADLLGEDGRPGDGEQLYAELLRSTDEKTWVWERLASYRDRLADESEGLQIPSTLPMEGDVPLEVAFLISRGRSRTSNHWRNLALIAWERAYETDPGNKMYCGRIGAAWMDLGYPEKAREFLQKSLIHSVGDSETYNRLGRLHLAAGDMASALHRLEDAADSSPLKAVYWADLGYARFLNDDFKTAGDAFRQALERDPENGTYAANTGISLYRGGDADEALTFLYRAVKTGGGKGRWRNALGLVLLATGAHGEALDAFQEACVAEPSNDLFAANLKLAYATLHAPGGLLQ